MGDDDRGLLWLSVAVIGIYHGLNPAMGWPLAVARGLEQRRGAAVWSAMGPLGAGHLAAMAVVLVPFALLGWFVAWNREIRLAAGAAVLVFGVYKLAARRHPRLLARIRPTRIALWSFLMATAHGAGLMLLPIAIDLCAAGPSPAASLLMRSGVGTALAVAGLHTAAMLGAGLAVAWLVYRHLGLRFLNRGWYDLDAVWGVSLVIAGGASVGLALSRG